jgi:hypothetical protein
MSQQFYIAVNGYQTGPFSIDNLKTKNIQRDTLVWTEGLEKWTKAEDIPILREVLLSTPPPLPNIETKSTSQQVPPLPKANTTVYNNKYFGYELARRRERLFATIIEAIIIAIPVLILFFHTPQNKAAGTSLLIIALNCLTALLAKYAIWNEINWRYPLIIAICALIIAWISSHLAPRTPTVHLKRGFAFLLFAIAAFTIITELFI